MWDNSVYPSVLDGRGRWWIWDFHCFLFSLKNQDLLIEPVWNLEGIAGWIPQISTITQSDSRRCSLWEMHVPPGLFKRNWHQRSPGGTPLSHWIFLDIQYHLYRLHVRYLPDRGMRTKKNFRFCPPLGLVRSLGQNLTYLRHFRETYKNSRWFVFIEDWKIPFWNMWPPSFLSALSSTQGLTQNFK